MITNKDLITFETKVSELFLDKKIRGPVHLSGGNEEQLLSIFNDIHKDDWVFSTHRYHYHYLLKSQVNKIPFNVSSQKLIDHLLHNITIHIFDKSLKFFTSAIVGGIIPIATGVALCIKRYANASKVWCFIGDGATDSGHFYEAVRYATDQDLPITFVIENNNYSCDTTINQRWGNGIGKFNSPKVVYYEYARQWPHVGVGKYVSF